MGTRSLVLIAALSVAGCKGGGTATDGGIAGAAGAAGATGAAGETGTVGTAGTIGASGTTGAAGATGASGTTGAAGTTSAKGCGKDLSGTWDLILAASPLDGSAPIGLGVMVISADTFSITVSNPKGPDVSPRGHLDYSAKGGKTATWQQGASPLHTFGIQTTPVVLNTGSLPLALGGAWTFTGKIGACSAQVGVGLVSGRCLSNEGDYDVGNGDWPSHLGTMVNGRTYTATRTGFLDSNFGELGGIWQAQSDAGSGRGCTITIFGDKLTAQCTVLPFYGKTELTIGDDCVASGLNNGGHELSARRR